jgi:polysaccharide pyruvyl transferase WcaK-like protein
VKIVRDLQGKNLKVLLLPHVLRPGSDDLVACARVFDEVRDPDVVLVDRLLTPQEIRGLCERARLIVTGRMHLAIMALSLGKPAITFSTQGKVEGLMELFGTGFLMIDPCVGMSSDVVPLIDRVEADYDSIVLEISRRLPAIVQLSAANVRGL